MISTIRLIMMIVVLSVPTLAWSNGFYFGLGAGPEIAKFNKNSTITGTGFLVKDNSYLAGNGIFGSIFAGHAWMHDELYVAGELNFNYSNVKHQSSNNEFIHSNFSGSYYRLRRNVGISVLPGYLMKPATLLYARLGYAMGYFNISSSDSSTGNLNKNLQGLTFGLGLNQALSEHCAIRLEYSQVNYQSTSTTTNDTVGGTMKTTNIAPTVSNVEFALLYNFTNSSDC